MMQFGRSVTMPGHRLIAVFGSAGNVMYISVESLVNLPISIVTIS